MPSQCLFERLLGVSVHPNKTSTELSLWQLMREDYDAHRKDWTLPGFRSVAACRFGQWRMHVQPRAVRAPLSILYRWMFRWCRNIYGIELPYSVKLGRRVIVEHQGGIVIHGNSEIGDDCVIRQGVTLGNRYPDRPYEAPILGKRVSVGAGAKILGRVVIGDDAIIGANAVVLYDVPKGTTVAGIPARPIGQRSTSPEVVMDELELEARSAGGAN